jgi:transposase
MRSAWSWVIPTGRSPAVVVVHVPGHHASPDGIWCWLDSASNLSCINSTQAHCGDAEHQPTDLAVGGSNPSRRAPKLTGLGCRLDGWWPSWSGPARRVRIDLCLPSLAALRHNKNVNGSRPAGCAGELFAIGVRQAEIARQLGVSRQAVSLWHARFKAGGTDALRSRGPTGPSPRRSDQQLAGVEQALLEGASANGFTGELWTLERIAIVIQRLTGVRHHPAHVWALLHHRLG